MTDPVRRSALGRWAAFVVVMWLAAFLVFPVVNIVTGQLVLSDASRVLTQQSTWHIVWFSAWQSALSVVTTFVVSAPVTWLIGRYRFRGRRWLRAVATVGFLLPSVVVATAFLAVLPRSLHYSVTAVVVAHAYFNVAVVVRVVGARAELLDAQLSSAARTLGASPFMVVRTVTWPLIRGAIASAGAVIFLYCFT